ncbi:MAG: NUDIX hydrolase [bacterium]|nr:NUDIX hydrolase [bacterium]
MMEKQKEAEFQISLKVLMRNGNKVLLTKGKDDIDLPGGRIDVGEESMPFEEVILREVREELGKDVKFRLGSILFMHHLGHTKEKGGILNIVFDAEYISGDIKLSHEHVSYDWVDGRTYEVQREDFFPEDQEKYEMFKNHFISLRKA